MRVGKTVKEVTAPKRRVRKAGESPVPYREDEKPIPVEIPKKKVKKKEEVEAIDDFQYFYRMSWGWGVHTNKSPIIYTTGVS